MSAAYLLERAWVDGEVRDDVLVEVLDGRFTAVRPGASDPGAWRVSGLTLPGLANCHSHAFHRALRGRTQRDRGTFWSWREQMYAVAERLDPDSYFQLAVAVFQEMLAAGYTTVGEFHYLHHQPDGRPYTEPNAMGRAVVEAAREAGIRIALLDACYLSSAFGKEPEGVQRRFSDGTAQCWAERVSAFDDLPAPGAAPVALVGAAIHSVRAVPADQLGPVVEWAGSERSPLHVHLSEQVAENADCLAAYGVTPTRLLHDHGALGPHTTAVHATHLTDSDVALLGGQATYACFCPTTERDLGDGIGPSRALRRAGARLTIGSDSQAVVDPFEEMRAVELDERLASQERGHWSAAELLTAATTTGHASLGYADVGRIAVGQRADLVTIDTSSLRTAGTGGDEQTAVFAATAADIDRVMVDGVLRATREASQDIGRKLDAVVRKLLGER